MCGPVGVRWRGGFVPGGSSSYHTPVLADAVLRFAVGAVRAVDATVGGGGHAEILRHAGAEVLAIDRDPEALEAARARLGSDGLRYLGGAFGDEAILEAVQGFQPDLVLLDLGVSGRQLTALERGFTFRVGAPLDMRMTPGAGPTAADLLNSTPPEQLGAWFRDYADEPRAAKLARCIARRRARRPLTVSDDLVSAIREVHGPRAGPATFARIFQAVRIAVNDEVGELERSLPAFRDALVPGGRLLVISYHSGEDRIVKHAFAEWVRSCVCPPGQPICTCRGRPLGSLPARRGIQPTPEEVEANPRSRSARLRVFVSADAA